MTPRCVPCSLGQEPDRRLALYADLAGIGVAFAVVGVLAYFVTRRS